MNRFGGVRLTTDLAWPWNLPGVGPAAFVGIAVLLVFLTFWTYKDVRKATRPRVLLLVGLRLLALLVALLAVLRPSLAIPSSVENQGVLLVAVDRSRSMTIQDQHDSLSRWDYLNQLMLDCQPEFERLQREHQISVRLHTFAEQLGDYKPGETADGKRTDFGTMLQSLHDRYAGERHLRGLLVLSDGADNGTRLPALTIAGRVRTLPCPVSTFAFGKTTTSSHQSDIALVNMVPDPSPVPIKGKLTVRGIIDAPGFEGAVVHARLELNGAEVTAGDFKMTKSSGNEVQLTCDAPAEPGEVKVTLKADPLPGEVSQLNNEISTFVTVTKEGLSVLYVEGKFRYWEPKFIRLALAQLPNIRLYETVRLSDLAAPPGDRDVLQFGKQHYDVVILGDISARRLSGGDPEVLEGLRKLVADKGTGLLMIGGYETFGNSDWNNTDVAKVLPVRLDQTGQIDQPVQMVPTQEGLRHFILRLADREQDNERLWLNLPKLDGVTRLGTPKPGAQVLARSASGEPLLVGQLAYGKGRTMAFAGDTTWLWCRSVEDMRLHARFWQQMILWLAKREEANGNLLVLPDSRRLAAGTGLGFRVMMRGKGGIEIPPENMHVEVSIRQPDGKEVKVPLVAERGELRGNFLETDVPGEYELQVSGSGKEMDGSALENLPPGLARFVIYQDEAEMARQGADHAFLQRLATAGGGKSYTAEDLKSFLRGLGTEPDAQDMKHARLWPDWRKGPAASTVASQWSTLTSSGIALFYGIFAGCLCMEWLLRRLWGFV